MINKEVVVFQIEDMLSNINKENLLSFGGHIDNSAAFLELMTNVLTLLKEQEEIVHCKDCIHWSEEYDHNCMIRQGWFSVSPDYFCASGERKEGGKVDG